MGASGGYAQHSAWSHPGAFADRVACWPTDLHALSRLIDKVIRHPRGTSLAPFMPAQRQDLLLRSVAELLARAQELEILDTPMHDDTRKVGGVCRDFALLAVAALRQRGIAARLRVGFADYFTPGFFEDHWVCQWHDGARWRLLDVECAARPIEGAELDFQPADVPRSRFLFASDAWAATENGRLDAACFGVSALKIGGRWFIAESLFRDQAALLKIELKPWDSWGIPSADDALRESASVQRIASRLDEATNTDSVDMPPGWEIWERPETVISYPFGEPFEVRVAKQQSQ